MIIVKEVKNKIKSTVIRLWLVSSQCDSSLLGCCSLSVRGLKSDSAVLCTNDESFEVKEAETSNSLLLLPQCQFTAQSLNCCAEPSAISRQVLLTLTLVSAVLHTPVCMPLETTLRSECL